MEPARVLAPDNRSVAGKRTRGGRERVGGAEHGAAGLDGVKALPDHRDNGAGGHVLDEAREERLAREVAVVCADHEFSRAYMPFTTYASRGARPTRGRASWRQA